MSGTDHDFERLTEIDEIIIKFGIYIVLACSALLLVLTIGVLFIQCKRRSFSKLPLKVRITLIVFLLMQIAYLLSQTMLVICNELFDSRIKNFNRIEFVIAMLLWVAVHWQFTAYYMQTACLFLITLRMRSEEEIARVKRRRAWLQVTEFIVYALILFGIVFLCSTTIKLHRAVWDTLFISLIMFSILAMTLITFFSFSHIHRNS